MGKMEDIGERGEDEGCGKLKGGSTMSCSYDIVLQLQS